MTRKVAAVPGERAETAMAALERLFTAHGPPLVLKLDNGSAFRATLLMEFLAEREVAIHYSPRRRPRYNGAIEAFGERPRLGPALRPLRAKAPRVPRKAHSSTYSDLKRGQHSKGGTLVSLGGGLEVCLW